MGVTPYGPPRHRALLRAQVDVADRPAANGIARTREDGYGLLPVLIGHERNDEMMVTIPPRPAGDPLDRGAIGMAS